MRDRALGRPLTDLDLVVDGDPEQAARAIARAAGRAACFALSEDFGAWRVVARDRAWQADLERLRGGSLQEDLRLRDFTVNAIAEPLEGGAPIDPLGGLEDLSARPAADGGPGGVRRRSAAGAAPRADRGRDGARAGGADQRARRAHTRASWAGSRPSACSWSCAGSSPRRGRDTGIELLDELGAMAVVLPELAALQGIEQSRFHHLDVYGHTLEVLDRTIELQADPSAVFGEEHARRSARAAGRAAGRRADARRGAALGRAAARRRQAADAGSAPQDGRVTFIGHDAQGAELARTVLGRLRASERLRAHVAALVRNHLRLGFLVHEPQPLARRTVYSYLTRAIRSRWT